jgi:site-specific DNA recombinase
MTPTATSFDGYIRVSRVGGREGDSFISPDVQRQQILSWAALRGVSVGQFHEDLDQTGGKLSRPGLDALMERIRSGKTGGVAVARLDRLSRAGVSDALRLVEDIHDHGGSLAAIDLGIDPTTTFGEFALTIMLALARMERRRIAESWDTAGRRAIERGVHFGPFVPYGYERAAGKPLQVIGELLSVVTEIFERRAARQSMWVIVDWLNASHPRADGRRWTESTVERMIHNTAYLGEARHGEHRNPDAHEAMVSPSLFAAANAVTGGSGRTKRDDPPILGGGLLRCAACRYVMAVAQYVGRDGVKVDSYRCRGKHGGGDCPAPATIAANKIEPAVILHALTVFGSASWQDDAPNTDALRALGVELEHAERRRADFLADHELRERIARSAYLAEADRLEAVVEEARALVETEQLAHGIADLRRRVLVEEWLEWDGAERAEALRQMLDSVYVKRGRGSLDGRLLIVQAGADDFDKPVRGGTEYVTAEVPWPEAPDVDPDYEPEPSAEAMSSSVPAEDLRLALAGYPADVVDALLGPASSA